MDLSKERERGMAGETVAAQYLLSIGYTILARNYRKRCGEIDIIAKDGEYVVFAEVKCRSGWSTPREAVTPEKQLRLQRTAELWIAEQGYGGFCRFDVLEVFFGCAHAPLVNHWRNAF